VSVDVQLNFDHVKVTTEEVLPGKGVDGAPAGVLVRERQTLRDAPARARDKAEPAAAEATVTHTESEYQTGRRVEQIVGTPGSVRRINVGVVVPRGVSPDRLDRIRQIVAMSAGIDAQRGDGVAVYSLDQMADGAAALKPAAAVEATDAVPAALASGAAPARDTRQPDGLLPTVLAGLLAIVAAIALLLAWRRRAAHGAVPPGEPRLLAEAQRQALLLNMQRWLEAPARVRERESLE
jgi:flagellar M-ring protein FliF